MIRTLLEAGKLFQPVLRLLRLQIGARHPDRGDAGSVTQPSLIVPCWLVQPRLVSCD